MYPYYYLWMFYLHQSFKPVSHTNFQNSEVEKYQADMQRPGRLSAEG